VKREEEFQKIFKENADLKKDLKAEEKQVKDLTKKYEEQVEKITFLEDQVGDLKRALEAAKKAGVRKK